MVVLLLQLQHLKFQSPFYICILLFTYVWSSYSSSTSDMLFIRHGRSRVRHSNEKDHIRWGLKAFDNLTLEDYDVTDNYDNDTTIMLFGSDLWANDNLTSNYINHTNIYNQNLKGIIKIVNNNTNSNYNEDSNKSNNNNNKNNNGKLMITQMPLTAITFKKKLQKKKIMENIRKDVNKGLEYLKMHKNLQNNDFKQTSISSIAPIITDDTYNNDFTTMSSISSMSSSNNGISSLNKKIFNDGNDEENKNFKFMMQKNKKMKSNLQNSEITKQKSLVSSSLLSSSSSSSSVASYQTTNYTDGILSTAITNKSLELSFQKFDGVKKNLTNSSFTTPQRMSAVAYYKKQQLLVHDEDETNIPKAIHNDNENSSISNNSYINKNNNNNGSNRSSSDGGRNSKTVVSLNLVKNKDKKDNDENSSTIQNIILMYDGLNQSAVNISKIHEIGGNGIRQHNLENRNSKIYQKIKIKEEQENNENEENIEEDDSNVNVSGNYDADNNNNDENEDDDVDRKFNDNGMSIGFEMDGEIEVENVDDENSDDSENDETVTFNVYGTTDEDLSELDEISRNNRLNLMKGRDVVTKFLQIVESQHLLGANCTAGTALNLGEGVVDQYAQDRFRIEAEVAVNRANMLTR